MKSFSEFIAEETYNREKYSKKIVKTADSVYKQLRRTNWSQNNSHTRSLIRKYDNLIDYMKEHDPEGWIKLCKDKDWAPGHDGHDLLA